MRNDFATAAKLKALLRIETELKKAERRMRQAKFAARRVQTRKRLELGEAVEAAGASHLSRDEIIAVLSNHLGTASDDDAPFAPQRNTSSHTEPRRPRVLS